MKMWSMQSCGCGGWWFIPQRGSPQHFGPMSREVAMAMLDARNK